MVVSHHGECAACGKSWAGYVLCEGPCDFRQYPNDGPAIDLESFEAIERRRSPAKLPPAVIEVAAPMFPPGYQPPPGFGPSPAAPIADSRPVAAPPAGFGPSVGTPARPGAPVAARTPAEFGQWRPLVPADEMCRRLRAEARKCDFDESERATALLDRVAAIERNGEEYVPDEKMSSY